MANAFLNHKNDLLVSHFGKGRLVADLGSDDFAGLRKAMAKRWGPVRVRNYIQQVRSVFKYGHEAGLLREQMRFGPGFARPTQKTLRLEQAKKGLRMFEAAELRRVLDAAGQPLKAMILLGANCGFGNADCGNRKECFNSATAVMPWETLGGTPPRVPCYRTSIRPRR